MSHDGGLPCLANGVRKKCVPPGSHLYEQVLDDLRKDSSPSSTLSSCSSSSSLSSSSTVLPPSLSQPDYYNVTAQAELCGGQRSLGHYHNTDISYCARAAHAGGGDVNREWLRERAVCSASATLPSSGGVGRGDVDRCLKGKEVVVEKGRRLDESEEREARSCVHVCDFLADLKLKQNKASDEMGHTSSLLHKHHKKDYIARDAYSSPHSHAHHQQSPLYSPKRSQSTGSTPIHKTKSPVLSGHAAPVDLNATSHFNRPMSLSPATSLGHVVSWSASSGCQSHSSLFTSEDDLGDKGSSSNRAHQSLFRLYPWGTNASARQTSPSPNRTGSGDQRGRTPYPFSTSQGHEERAGGDRRRRESGRSPMASPKRSLLPDVHHPRHRNSGPGYPLSPTSSPTFQRCLANELSRRHHEAWRTPSPISTSPQHSPDTRSTSPSLEHVRLCTIDADDPVARDSSDTDSDFSLPPDFVRLRSQSDVSVHVQRRRQLPRLPLLRQRHVEEGGQVHVHWADEAGGSPLATSVLLSSIRPRALSHGSVDLPRKPILKKPLGFLNMLY